MKENQGSKFVLFVIAAVAMLLLFSGCGEKDNADVDAATATPKPTPNIMEEMAGDYKRTVVDSSEGSGVMRFFSGVVNMFGDVILTLEPDGSGILDLRDIPGSYDTNYEYVTWSADHTIHIQDEDCTWVYEDGTLYIDGPEYHQEYERMK